MKKLNLHLMCIATVFSLASVSKANDLDPLLAPPEVAIEAINGVAVASISFEVSGVIRSIRSRGLFRTVQKIPLAVGHGMADAVKKLGLKMVKHPVISTLAVVGVADFLEDEKLDFFGVFDSGGSRAPKKDPDCDHYTQKGTGNTISLRDHDFKQCSTVTQEGTGNTFSVSDTPPETVSE